MTMTDPIADMLTRIRNSYMAKKQELVLPYSKVKFAIAKILEKEDYIEKAEIDESGKFKQIKIELKYNNKQPAITKMQKISKAGRRVYAAHNELPRVLNGYGIAIISTSRGVMTNNEAKHAKVGGEVLCEIY
ncbi:MAG TPA: 30S ribosomal protein S8 [Patescibacteria group bacterium]|nr:30S ribosomal protein S8 [Patescibacteria group bacterium]